MTEGHNKAENRQLINCWCILVGLGPVNTDSDTIWRLNAVSFCSVAYVGGGVHLNV
jgi:hypothetical protein